MSSTGVNVDKPLELLQKTYHLPHPSLTPLEHSSHNRPSIGKVSQSQPSRKTSVHDVQEATREEFNRVRTSSSSSSSSRLDLCLSGHRGDSRRSLSSEWNSADDERGGGGQRRIRQSETPVDYQNHRIHQSIDQRIEQKVCPTNREREMFTSTIESLSSRSESNLKVQLSYNPQHLVYCVDYLRGELLKAQYLFSSLTLTASIGSSTLDNLPVKSLSSLNLQPSCNPTDIPPLNNEDLTELQRYSSSLSLRSRVKIPSLSLEMFSSWKIILLFSINVSRHRSPIGKP